MSAATTDNWLHPAPSSSFSTASSSLSAAIPTSSLAGKARGVSVFAPAPGRRVGSTHGETVIRCQAAPAPRGGLTLDLATRTHASLSGIIVSSPLILQTSAAPKIARWVGMNASLLTLYATMPAHVKAKVYLSFFSHLSAYINSFSLALQMTSHAASQRFHDEVSAKDKTISLNPWETTSDEKTRLELLPASSNVNFSKAGNGDADIYVDDSQVFQTIYGFGASMTDSAAYVLSKLKTSDAGAYNSLLKSAFDTTTGAKSAGLNYIRIPLGASDFSPNIYNFDDEKNDMSLSNFSIDDIPSYVFATLQDIQSINPNILIHLLPWSPPGWMKDSGVMDGGNFMSKYNDQLANYLYKSAQAFKSKGFNPYAISIQVRFIFCLYHSTICVNEVLNSNPTLPSAVYKTSTEAAVAVSLRKLFNSNNMANVKIVGYEHNWDKAAAYATQLMRENGASDAFDGVAFHCYAGNVGQQDDFHNAFPDKEIYFTECTGTIGSDWWSDIQFYMKNLFIGGPQHWSQSGLMWNLAVDTDGNPKLAGVTSCASGCRGVLQITSSGQSELSQEYFAMAHASKAILPLNGTGPSGKRIGMSVNGTQASSLTVGAYATSDSTDNVRYSLVVMNAGKNSLKTAVNFRGKKAIYTFPKGLTTMAWFSSASGN
ncbi:hypothetical protein EW145_g1844 [Phellinidium pouzarii]|uniref:Glycosyl hydrolase family 30 TIM-barrel domain-containing protein n=1 Tax=Phellinidium pouzarii TaxID=167371 RepID=A0A4S4LD74_9AGAM|nr:hypothetical protein EW145_g1844 [Phellinidium pouzarii]